MSEKVFIESIRVENLFNRFTYDIDLRNGENIAILIAPNGCGSDIEEYLRNGQLPVKGKGHQGIDVGRFLISVLPRKGADSAPKSDKSEKDDQE